MMQDWEHIDDDDTAANADSAAPTSFLENSGIHGLASARSDEEITGIQADDCTKKISTVERDLCTKLKATLANELQRNDQIIDEATKKAQEEADIAKCIENCELEFHQGEQGFDNNLKQDIENKKIALQNDNAPLSIAPDPVDLGKMSDAMRCKIDICKVVNGMTPIPADKMEEFTNEHNEHGPGQVLVKITHVASDGTSHDLHYLMDSSAATHAGQIGHSLLQKSEQAQ